MRTPVKRALLSVYDKTGLVEFARALHEAGVELLSTGGSAKSLQSAGIPVKEVAQETGSPEILDGRVKTLHPKIHGGLLAQRNDRHLLELASVGGRPIDLAVLNLYPFVEARAKARVMGEIIEMIDIGGPAMLRSAAKNYAFVGILTDPEDYPEALAQIRAGGLEFPLRQRLARKAFALVARYDNAIADFFAQLPEDAPLRESDAPPPPEPLPPRLSLDATRVKKLRYGENPHQQAAIYSLSGGRPDHAHGSLIAAAAQEGKALSFNNYLDLEAALNLVNEFSEPACAIIKHNNPCGAATGATLADAFGKALACDPTSAFGGILAVNREVDEAFVTALGKLFIECLAAPGVTPAARVQLESRKNLRLLVNPDFARRQPGPDWRLLNGALLAQTPDTITLNENELKIVTKRAPSPDEMRALKFAWIIAKHVKSNAIIFSAPDRTLAIGAGQMSRLDSVHIAAAKAKDAGISLENSAVASDAFFPFADGLLAAAAAGASSVIQPGGSMRDNEVIAAADEKNIAMVFTGIRHFRH